jgi:hypothetical protein
MGRRVRDDGVQHLFAAAEDLPCPKGIALLRAFADNRSLDFAFLKSSDLADLKNSAFTGIAEWDAFSDHYGCCGLCHA